MARIIEFSPAKIEEEIDTRFSKGEVDDMLDSVTDATQVLLMSLAVLDVQDRDRVRELAGLASAISALLMRTIN